VEFRVILSICGQTQTLTGPLARGGIDGSVERLVREAAEYRRNALLRDSVLHQREIVSPSWAKREGALLSGSPLWGTFTRLVRLPW